MRAARTTEKLTPPAGARSRDLKLVTRWEDIPEFDGEAQEVEFWEQSRLAVRLMESAIVTGAEASESVAICLRIDPRMLAKIKRIARSRYLNYQSMMKQWLSERMEQETRERNYDR
jgi:hypothetical protein